jgi:glycosyltransferase involved in cell wall biosynthesis
VLKLPHHLALPLDPPPTRVEARAALGLPSDALVVTAPGLATASKRLDVLIPVIAQLRAAYPQLLLVIAGAVDPQLPLAGWAQQAGLGDALRITGRLSMLDFERHLAAADVVSLLRFPSHGEMSGALVRALGVGRPVLVTAGSPAAAELPEGVVVPVDPGRHESAELFALVDHLLGDAALRERIGRLASEHVRRHHALAATLGTLVDFLQALEPQRAALVQAIEQERSEEGSLLGYLTEEVRWGARDIGLAGVNLGIAPALRELVTPAAEGPR